MNGSLDDLRKLVRECESALRTSIRIFQQEAKEPYLPNSPTIDQSLLDECKILSNRYMLLDQMPKGAVCAEVGTQFGHFAQAIFQRTSPRKFHVVDIEMNLFDRGPFEKPIMENIVVLHEGDSSSILDKFPDEYFDWIYIDAQHSYEGFSKDLEVSAFKVKKSGFIVCNDYTVYSPPEVYQYGVLRRLNEFCAAERWKMRFFALHPQGYHDVCIQRPMT